jgi:uroporphyrin-III C-methyltransferase
MKAASPPRVALVGAGPGDPELPMATAVRALRRATVVLVDALVAGGL